MSYVTKMLDKEKDNKEFMDAWEESALEYNVARNIISKRNELGLTQVEFARRMATSQSVISRIETGNANMTIKTLAHVANALETDIKELV